MVSQYTNRASPMKPRTRKTLIPIEVMTRRGWAGWLQVKPQAPPKLVITRANRPRKRKRRYRRIRRK